MTSKELNEILNKTRRTPNIFLTPEQVEELVKDLEKLEQYEKIFDTPLIEIRKQLEVLELIKILDEKIENNIIKRNEIIPNNTSIYKLNGKIEAYTDIKSLLEKEWLENEK